MSQQTSTTDLEVTATIEAPVERAFEAFTERAQALWPPMYRLGSAERVDLRVDRNVGGRWYEVGDDGSTTPWGEVLAWDPPSHVALGWQLTPSFGAEPDPAKASRVDVRFAADGPDRCTVTLVHSGFERHGAGWESMRAGVDGEGGWPGILRTLAELAARR